MSQFAGGEYHHTYNAAYGYRNSSDVPCQNCRDRYVGCHSECSHYLEWKKNREKERKERKEKERLYCGFRPKSPKNSKFVKAAIAEGALG